eukprot:3863999-Amphidinium_carterae.1
MKRNLWGVLCWKGKGHAQAPSPHSESRQRHRCFCRHSPTRPAHVRHAKVTLSRKWLLQDPYFHLPRKRGAPPDDDDDDDDDDIRTRCTQALDQL